MHSTPNTKGAARRAVLKLAKERDVRFVRLVFADILGVGKNVSIPASQLEAALDGTVTFDGGSIDGFVRGEELDMQLRPDPSTFALYPWNAGDGAEARLICDIAMPDGSPFEGCPRTTLRRALEDADLGSVAIGTEIEFYLFDSGSEDERFGSTSTRDVGSYFDFGANDRGEDARNAIVAALQAMNVPVASAHHEHGHGQHEIDLAPCDPLSAADHVLTVRTIAKHVAARFDLEATFMPKPSEGRAGSGLHVELRLPDADDETTLYAIGGLLEHAAATTAICNPTVNSYKRLVAAWDAPIYTVWSERSANALVRVPGLAQRRIEMRSPDPACNPYLAVAALLGAAADGVRRHLLPGSALVGSTYDLSERERRERGIGILPKSLRQAIDALERDAAIRAALGDHIFHAFRDAKLAEYETYRQAVHDWERRAYLRLY